MLMFEVGFLGWKFSLLCTLLSIPVFIGIAWIIERSLAGREFVNKNMRRALINPQLCINCTLCEVIEKCPMTAVFRESESDKPWVDFYRCCGCMKCMGFCPDKAVAEISHPCDGKRRIGW